MFGWVLKLMFGRDSEDEILSRFVLELLIWPKQVTLVKLNSTLGSVVPLAMFSYSFSFLVRTQSLFAQKNKYHTPSQRIIHHEKHIYAKQLILNILNNSPFIICQNSRQTITRYSKFKCLLRTCPCSMPAGSPRHPHHLLLHHLLLHLHLLPQQTIDIENPDTVIQTLTFKISKS